MKLHAQVHVAMTVPDAQAPSVSYETDRDAQTILDQYCKGLTAVLGRRRVDYQYCRLSGPGDHVREYIATCSSYSNAELT
jgi:hypothetical protein